MWKAAPAPKRPAPFVRTGFSLQPGMRVGLFGGSFNPAHEGHAHVAETARERLGLDMVLWLVSPQNPLKTARETAPLAERLASARGKARGPSMVITDLETRLGSQFTVDTVRALKARFPGVRFVWIMGADSLASFHRWKGWTQIFEALPVAVIDRPGGLRSRFSPAARRFARRRWPSAAARDLAAADPPAWAFITAPLNFQSSTALRERMRRPNP